LNDQKIGELVIVFLNERISWVVEVIAQVNQFLERLELVGVKI
jgi:hypothetical protein